MYQRHNGLNRMDREPIYMRRMRRMKLRKGKRGREKRNNGGGDEVEGRRKRRSR